MKGDRKVEQRKVWEDGVSDMSSRRSSRDVPI